MRRHVQTPARFTLAVVHGSRAARPRLPRYARRVRAGKIRARSARSRTSSSSSDRKDLKVLFILIDTLRADRLSAWGYPRETSPMIDWLASGGVRFARQLSQSSWTKCSMASLWTSLYPQRSGVLRFDEVLSSEAKLPAEILREAGFRTVGLFRNGWVAPNFGFSQGFEVYHQPARASADPERATRESLAARAGIGHERGRGLSLVPERLRARALVRLHPLDGRAPVHLRRAVGDVRHRDLGHLRQLDPPRGRSGRGDPGRSSTEPACSTRRWS